MRNVHILGFLLVLLLACTERGQSLKVKSFFFGLGGGDKKEEKSEGGKQEDSKPTQDTKGVNPAAEVSKSGDSHSSEGSPPPLEEAKQHSGEKAPESSSAHSSESGEAGHDSLPRIPPSLPPPPPPPAAPAAPESGQGGSSSSAPAPAPAQSGCSCSAAGKPLSDCCHESVYGEKRPGEKRNATITGTITGTITDSILTAKTGDVISVKQQSDKPVPECDHSNKQQSVTTTTHEASASLHYQQGGGKLPSLHASPDVGKGKFPNGASFVPLVLDANTGQYGVELKTMDMLVTGQDEKIKPFDMLIPFVNENGQIRFVTRRRLRQLVKSGLSKTFSEGGSPFSHEALAENAVELKEEGEKKPEGAETPKEEHKEQEPSEAEKGKEAANSAKSLLQEAEAVLTGGSLFEPPEKKEEEKKEEGKAEEAEGESGSEKKDSNESEEASDSSASDATKSKDKDKESESDSAMVVQDSASVHASEEEEEEEEQ